MPSPTRQLDDVLVVFDGPRRVQWSGAQDGTGVPVALWPDSTQLRHLQHHLARQAPLLVIVDYDRGPVPLLALEIATSPATLAPLLHSDGELTDLHIPLLDWLPAPLQARGKGFLRRAQAQRAATPGPLLPQLIVEDHPADPVRFALRANSRHLAEHELASTAKRLFGPFRRLTLADNPEPHSSDTTSREPITTGKQT